MGSWYRVTKKINGRLYDYWQRTYRVGKSVKTENRYIGPAHKNVSAPFSPSISTTAPLVPEDVMETYFRPNNEKCRPGNIRKLNAEKKAILRNEEHFDAGAFKCKTSSTTPMQ